MCHLGHMMLFKKIVDSYDEPIELIVGIHNDSICEGSSTEIIAEVTGGNGIYTYSWSNGLPPTAGAQTVSMEQLLVAHIFGLLLHT